MAASGQRKRRVSVYSLTETTGSSGFPLEEPTLLATVWASLTGEGGTERFATDQLSAPFDSKWELPYAAQWDPELIDVCKTRRLAYEGRNYDIVRAERTGLKRDDVAVWTSARQG